MATRGLGAVLDREPERERPLLLSVRSEQWVLARLDHETDVNARTRSPDDEVARLDHAPRDLPAMAEQRSGERRLLDAVRAAVRVRRARPVVTEGHERGAVGRERQHMRLLERLEARPALAVVDLVG